MGWYPKETPQIDTTWVAIEHPNPSQSNQKISSNFWMLTKKGSISLNLVIHPAIWLSCYTIHACHVGPPLPCPQTIQPNYNVVILEICASTTTGSQPMSCHHSLIKWQPNNYHTIKHNGLCLLCFAVKPQHKPSIAVNFKARYVSKIRWSPAHLWCHVS